MLTAPTPEVTAEIAAIPSQYAPAATGTVGVFDDPYGDLGRLKGLRYPDWTYDVQAILENPDRTPYAVLDDLDQLADRMPWLNTDEARYVVGATLVTKAHNPGWRWHKHGPYLGDGEPTSEHLGDEEHFDQVVCVSVWQLTD